MIGTKNEIIKWLFTQDKEKEFEIKEKKSRRKRSLNANRYAWKLMNEISEVIGNTKEEVYLEIIRNVGIFRTVTINEGAAETFKTVWKSQGLGWICETMGNSSKNDYTDIICYYGSSTYNTKQMARFIDYIVQEAKDLGIETLTPVELDRLKDEWR